MAFHLQELRKCYQQSAGSAAKLLQENQLKRRSLGDGSEQSSTVWKLGFFLKRALEQIPFYPAKRTTGPCRDTSARALGETTAGLQGMMPPEQGMAAVLLPLLPGSHVLAPWVMPKAWRVQVCSFWPIALLLRKHRPHQEQAALPLQCCDAVKHHCHHNGTPESLPVLARVWLSHPSASQHRN